MKILIAISSKKYSSQTLDVGMSVAKAFSAKTTIVDVVFGFNFDFLRKGQG